jgi:hypothetical protein
MGPLNAAMTAAGATTDKARDTATMQFEGASGNNAAPAGGAGASDTTPAGPTGSNPPSPPSGAPPSAPPSITCTGSLCDTSIPECGDKSYYDGTKCVPFPTTQMPEIARPDVKGQIDTAKWILLASAALITLASILWTIGEVITCSSGGAIMAGAMALSVAVGAIGGAYAAVTGGMILSQGGGLEVAGGILLAGGIATAVMGAWAYLVPVGGSMLVPIIGGAIITASMLIMNILSQTWGPAKYLEKRKCDPTAQPLPITTNCRS